MGVQAGYMWDMGIAGDRRAITQIRGTNNAASIRWSLAHG